MSEEECKCEFHKHKQRGEEEQKRLLNRLKRIEGQVRGVQTMIEDHIYCTDILIQVQAIRAALGAFSRELLTEHIKSCVAQGIREGNDEIITELTDVLYKMMK